MQSARINEGKNVLFFLCPLFFLKKKIFLIDSKAAKPKSTSQYASVLSGEMLLIYYLRHLVIIICYDLNSL